jgi:hypothetical protein
MTARGSVPLPGPVNEHPGGIVGARPIVTTSGPRATAQRDGISGTPFGRAM